MFNLIADYKGAASGIAGIIGVFWVLAFIYGIICFFVSVFVYRIMRRGTERLNALLRIESLLRVPHPTTNTVSGPAWDPKGIYGPTTQPTVDKWGEVRT
jgi:hypothetical protein